MGNHTKIFKWLIVVLVLGGFFLFFDESSAPTGEIYVSSPQAGDLVTSPLKLSGQARGYWYFEASAPVSVLDAEGNVLGQKYITAEGEWMTEDLVPFSGEITFSTPSTDTGEVVFKNDNPSGDVERDKYFRVPVRFR